MTDDDEVLGAYDMSHKCIAEGIDAECRLMRDRDQWPTATKAEVLATVEAHDLDCLPLIVGCVHGMWRLVGVVERFNGNAFSVRATYRRCAPYSIR